MGHWGVAVCDSEVRLLAEGGAGNFATSAYSLHELHIDN